MVAVERKAPSSPVLCPLSSVLCPRNSKLRNLETQNPKPETPKPETSKPRTSHALLRRLSASSPPPSRSSRPLHGSGTVKDGSQGMAMFEPMLVQL